MARFLTLRRSLRPLTISLLFAALSFASARSACAAQFPGALTHRASASEPAAVQPLDTLAQDGPFTIADQHYTVLFHYATLSANSASAAPSAKSPSTLSSLQILDAHANSVYQQTFPYTVSERRFTEKLTASASLLGGNGGAVMVIRFLDQPVPAPGAAHEFAKESWQLFGVANGHFAPFGAPLPLGQGTDITVGGTVAAVMMRGGIAVMPIASTAEVLAFRAWTGNFYAAVPVRFDWAHGQWGAGSQCYQTANGTLTERGCIMSLDAKPQPRPPDADTLYVHLFVAPDGNADNSQNIPVSPGSDVELLEMQAIVDWHSQGQSVSCNFRSVWVRTRIDGNEGWVHGQDAFDALGLPVSSPQ